MGDSVTNNFLLKIFATPFHFYLLFIRGLRSREAAPSRSGFRIPTGNLKPQQGEKLPYETYFESFFLPSNIVATIV